ncbi:MAG: hypothetical protein ACTSPS_14115 [Promethearchaeota archaeon]
MSKNSEWNKVHKIALKPYLKSKVIKNAQKLRGKFPAISEMIEDSQRTLTVQNIFKLRDELKGLFLFSVKNYDKYPKIRYFLAIQLASQSSDFLVALSRDFAVKNDLKLIQYSVVPKTTRISLLSLKEIKEIEDFEKSIGILQDFREKFRKKIAKIKNLVENE